MADGKWQMEDGKWKMANGRWEMEDGKWKMANGRWQMEDGNWKMATASQGRRGRLRSTCIVGRKERDAKSTGDCQKGLSLHGLTRRLKICLAAFV
jgi:hypothetical protein